MGVCPRPPRGLAVAALPGLQHRPFVAAELRVLEGDPARPCTWVGRRHLLCFFQSRHSTTLTFGNLPPTCSPLISIGGGSGSGPGGTMTRQGHKHNNDMCYIVFSRAMWKWYCRTSTHGLSQCRWGSTPPTLQEWEEEGRKPNGRIVGSFFGR